MSGFLDGIGAVLSKVTNHFQGRIERLKNERERLLNERKKLMDGVPTSKSVNRIYAIDDRLQAIRAIITNTAKD